MFAQGHVFEANRFSEWEYINVEWSTCYLPVRI